MSTESSGSAPADASPAPNSDLTINLKIVSPSFGVRSPLFFPDTAGTITVKELKEIIRQKLSFKPRDEHQRLIHNGRALTKDTDTLVDIFGAEAIRKHDQLTMHLVVRDASANPSSSTSNSARALSPASATHPSNTFPPPPPVGSQPPPGFPRRNPVQPSTNVYGPPPAAGPTAPPANPGPEAAAAFHQHHSQHMSAWLTHLQRESMTRVLNQNQRTRAAMGARGVGDHGQHGTGPQDPNGGRASPALGHYYRETVGPNGQTYQVETIVRGSGPQQGGGSTGLTPAEVQNMLRSADMSQATAAMTNAMHRSASGASLHSAYSRSLNQPGVTVPVHPLSDSRAPSGRATPDPNARPVSGGSSTATAGGPATTASTTQPRQGVDVYILSSPEGPRGLLVNNDTSETYYTPRLPTQLGTPRIRSLMSPVLTAPGTPLPGGGEAQNNGVNGGQPAQEGQNQQQGGPQLQDGVADPDNPNEAGLPPLLVQAWPHIWLLFRLGVFIWFFTSPNSTWARWFSIVGMAIFIFILSIGALHNIADLAWRPIAQQLEHMLPRPQLRGAQGHQQGEGRDPQPADMAARLVAQQENDNWLQGQIRRIERASLLFLASIAPGVAERHIANLEAEARAEQQRREAEAAEAARQQEEAEGDANANREASGAAATEQGEEPAEAAQPAGEGQAPQPDLVTT